MRAKRLDMAHILSVSPLTLQPRQAVGNTPSSHLLRPWQGARARSARDPARQLFKAQIEEERRTWARKRERNPAGQARIDPELQPLLTSINQQLRQRCPAMITLFSDFLRVSRLARRHLCMRASARMAVVTLTRRTRLLLSLDRFLF